MTGPGVAWTKTRPVILDNQPLLPITSRQKAAVQGTAGAARVGVLDAVGSRLGDQQTDGAPTA